MSWENLNFIEAELNDALRSFNWKLVEEICEKLVLKIYRDSEDFPVSNSKRILSNLRQKRRFRLMGILAEAILRSGQTHSQVRRQYAQSLIDRQILSAGELLLDSMLQDADTLEPEKIEAHGLLGRIYKQLYLNVSGNHAPRKRAFLQRAIEEYLFCYNFAPDENYWHGINVVALLMRGRKDNITLQGMSQPAILAEEILTALKVKENESAEPVRAFEAATVVEALVALNRYEEAVQKTFDYIQCQDADVFEITSTLRQFTEVWQLNDEESPGSEILPILRAALLEEKGGELTFRPRESRLEIQNLFKLEKAFGLDKTQTLKWYKTGLERAKSIARMETVGGRGFGTGWLVDGSDFFPNYKGLLLVTNAHIVSNYAADAGLPPYQVRANFQETGKIYELGEIIWSSPEEDLDTTFITINGDLSVKPLPINVNPVQMSSPPPRVYIIGHPGGRDIEISIHDNHLIDCNEKFLHYRAPTEAGSSGSPVFDNDGWRVVALHHSGRIDMPELNKRSGTYEANEGITILAIKKEIEKGS